MFGKRVKCPQALDLGLFRDRANKLPQPCRRAAYGVGLQQPLLHTFGIGRQAGKGRFFSDTSYVEYRKMPRAVSIQGRYPPRSLCFAVMTGWSGSVVGKPVCLRLSTGSIFTSTPRAIFSTAMWSCAGARWA
jgi:hypothetical protein